MASAFKLIKPFFDQTRDQNDTEKRLNDKSSTQSKLNFNLFSN